VAGTVTAATELTIQWNGIEGVEDIFSAGQTISMIIGIEIVTRVLYVGVFPDIEERESSSSPVSIDRFPPLAARPR
jgi:hypothetical protein